MRKGDLVAILGLVCVVAVLGWLYHSGQILQTGTAVARLGDIEDAFTISGIETSSSQEPLAALGDFEGDRSGSLPVWFDEGGWLIGLKHGGRGEFAVALYDEDGKHLRDLASAIGSFSDVASMSIERAGMYSLDITADGSWRVTIRGCTCPASGY